MKVYAVTKDSLRSTKEWTATRLGRATLSSDGPEDSQNDLQIGFERSVGRDEGKMED